MSSTRDGHILVPIGLFGGIVFVIAADLVSDYHAVAGTARCTSASRPWPAPWRSSAWASSPATPGPCTRAADDFERDLRNMEVEAQQWREEARNALEGFGAAVDREFVKWGLTEAERDVALLCSWPQPQGDRRRTAHQRGDGAPAGPGDLPQGRAQRSLEPLRLLPRGLTLPREPQ